MFRNLLAYWRRSRAVSSQRSCRPLHRHRTHSENARLGSLRLESLEPRFALAASFTTAKFDFGTTSSPVEAGYLRVAENTKFSTTSGYGWSAGTIYSVDRATSSSLSRDLNYMTSGTFSVIVPNGAYQVNLQLGDLGSYAHDQVGVYLENAQRDTVSTAARQIVGRSFQVTVSDGQLDLRLTDLGGSDRNCVIVGMDFKQLTPTLTVSDVSVNEGTVAKHKSPLRPVCHRLARYQYKFSMPQRMGPQSAEVTMWLGVER